MGDMASARSHLGGVQFAQVAVDTETGVVRVERVVAVHDCGRPINPRQIESQIHGGILQGISYALYEERVLDRASGLMLNANLEQYKMLRAREAAGDRSRDSRELPGHELDGRLRRRRAGDRCDGSGGGERRLQRDRRADARAADDARQESSRALGADSGDGGGDETLRMGKPADARAGARNAHGNGGGVHGERDRQPPTEAAILKAGGIDLLGLMKDGCWRRRGSLTCG